MNSLISKTTTKDKLLQLTSTEGPATGRDGKSCGCSGGFKFRARRAFFLLNVSLASSRALATLFLCGRQLPTWMLYAFDCANVRPQAEHCRTPFMRAAFKMHGPSGFSVGVRGRRPFYTDGSAPCDSAPCDSAPCSKFNHLQSYLESFQRPHQVRLVRMSRAVVSVVNDNAAVSCFRMNNPETSST